MGVKAFAFFILFLLARLAAFADHDCGKAVRVLPWGMHYLGSTFTVARLPGSARPPQAKMIWDSLQTLRQNMRDDEMVALSIQGMASANLFAELRENLRKAGFYIFDVPFYSDPKYLNLTSLLSVQVNRQNLDSLEKELTREFTSAQIISIFPDAQDSYDSSLRPDRVSRAMDIPSEDALAAVTALDHDRLLDFLGHASYPLTIEFQGPHENSREADRTAVTLLDSIDYSNLHQRMNPTSASPNHLGYIAIVSRNVRDGIVRVQVPSVEKVTDFLAGLTLFGGSQGSFSFVP